MAQAISGPCLVPGPVTETLLPEQLNFATWSFSASFLWNKWSWSQVSVTWSSVQALAPTESEKTKE